MLACTMWYPLLSTIMRTATLVITDVAGQVFLSIYAFIVLFVLVNVYIGMIMVSYNQIRGQYSAVSTD